MRHKKSLGDFARLRQLLHGAHFGAHASSPQTNCTEAEGIPLVVIEIAPQLEIISVITTEGAGSLKLKKGQTAYALIKASNVTVGVD